MTVRLVITIDTEHDVKPSARQNEIQSAEAGNGLRAALRKPVFVSGEKIASPFENVRNGELCDFIYRKEWIGYELESGDGLVDQRRIARDRHPADLHARQCEHL